MKNIILTQQEINHKTKRIAFQIYETFVDENEVVLAGIASNGYIFAQKIAKELEQISDLKVILCEVKINKENPKYKPAIPLCINNIVIIMGFYLKVRLGNVL